MSFVYEPFLPVWLAWINGRATFRVYALEAESKSDAEQMAHRQAAADEAEAVADGLEGDTVFSVRVFGAHDTLPKQLCRYRREDGRWTQDLLAALDLRGGRITRLDSGRQA